MFGGNWSASLTPSALGVDALEEVIGNSFTFYFYVTGDTTVYTKGPCFVFRVLEEVPQTTSPDSNAGVTTPYPTLLWPQFTSSYPARLRVEVKQVDELIWSSDTLDVSTTQITVPDSLENVTYWWALFVYDNFNNMTRSREAYFVVDTDTTQ
ncbi:hypothetical protein IT157_08330 [bacterium]|nr:hypothetical protein [bacterium]